MEFVENLIRKMKGALTHYLKPILMFIIEEWKSI